MATALPPNLDLTDLIASSKLAPALSILFTKTILGTL
jgi:hypothetical protein